MSKLLIELVASMCQTIEDFERSSSYGDRLNSADGAAVDVEGAGDGDGDEFVAERGYD